MNIPESFVPAGVLLGTYLIWFMVLLLACWRAPWSRLRVGDAHHVFLGAMVVLLFLWRFEAGVTPGLSFHFLGVTVFTLMFGGALAVIGVSLVTLGVVLSGGGTTLEMLPLNALLFGVLPVAITQGIYQLVHRMLPHHVFIYIFLCAFFAAIFSAAIVVFTLVGILTWSQTYSFARIAEEYLPFLPLYLFPEGLLNGMLTTIFVGIRPQWLSTFDDESYLKS